MTVTARTTRSVAIVARMAPSTNAAATVRFDQSSAAPVMSLASGELLDERRVLGVEW